MRQYIYILFFSAFFYAVNAQINEAARYEIDAKRIGINPTDKDALYRSREFIRLDSTYYVGYMYEGFYKFERSSDYLGYKQAIVPLKKAFSLLQHDYKKRIEQIFSSINYFNENKQLFDDFYWIANTLRQSYNSIELPDSTMNLLNELESYHFQKDFFSIGSDMAWLYHRNRFLTSKEHSFLKNSISENEKMAFNQCYAQINYIQKNKNVNDYWYGSYQSEGDLLTVYHYLAILHDYNENYDSSIYYYNVLANARRVSWSNFGNMQHEIGYFAQAVDYYAKPQFKAKYALDESYYYMPLLFVYGGKTKEAVTTAKNKLLVSNSVPGFGWYSIALARGYLYDGQLDSSEFYLDKATNFKELHINTTLTQSQYNFTINLLRLQLVEKRKEKIKFLNSGWWYSPADIYEVIALKIEKIILEYSLSDALANNPERDKIVYNLFCSETTVSFDESMFLLKDFSLPYFIDKYKTYTAIDKRKKLNKYFRLYLAKLYYENGNSNEATKIGESLFNETVPTAHSNGNYDDKIDTQYDRLYLYRLLEMLAHVSDEQKATKCMANCLEVYPQLIPFSGMSIKMNVSFSGLQDDKTIKDIVAEIKDSKIDFVSTGGVPKATIDFKKKGNMYKAVLNVHDKNGKHIIKNQELFFSNEVKTSQEIVMHLFNIGDSEKIN